MYPWTEAEDALLGLCPDKELALYLGTSRRTVYKRRKELGVEPRWSAASGNNLSRSAIAKIVRNQRHQLPKMRAKALPCIVHPLPVFNPRAARLHPFSSALLWGIQLRAYHLKLMTLSSRPAELAFLCPEMGAEEVIWDRLEEIDQIAFRVGLIIVEIEELFGRELSPTALITSGAFPHPNGRFPVLFTRHLPAFLKV